MAPPTDIPDGWRVFGRSSPFLDSIGPLYEFEAADDFALGLRIEERHCNRRRIAHGGLLVTLADMVLGYACVRQSADTPFITVGLTTDFAGSAGVGDWVEARADVQRIATSLAFANCYLSVGKRRIVRASGTFAIGRKRPKS